MKNGNVSVRQVGYWIKVEINGLPHVVFRADEFVGLHAYYAITGSRTSYWIEYVTRHGTVETEFDQRDHWELLLMKLNEYFT